MTREPASGKCQKCGTSLVVGENWTTYRQNQRQYVCTPCRLIYQRKYNRERSHQLGINCPMGKNRDCSKFLGIHVAEQVLTKVFDNVEVMPHNNIGFDIICNRRKKIDVKSSCMHKNGRWMFNIKHNMIADYFLFLAFDNRKYLNPLYIKLMFCI